ncbi:MAG: phytanoyl-CoA dioxygenase family protein [Actinomycetota bacterium]
MPATDHRLTTIEMARFVSQGYLRFDAVVPPELNAAALAVMPSVHERKSAAAVAGFTGHGPVGDRGDQAVSAARISECYPAPSPFGEFLRLPPIAGVIESLVGPDPSFDHDFVHHIAPGRSVGQHLHPDAIVDSTDPTFDIQLFWFPHEVEPGGGGTRFVPGTHIRRTTSAATAKYQHVAGEEEFAGPAGTVLVFHHGLWHCGQPNPGTVERWMYKVRLNPCVPQVRLWNLDDFDEVHNDHTDHTFATPRADSVAAQLRRMFPWEGTDSSRYDLVERIRLWRYVTGDESFDADYYLSRIERRAALLDA